MPHKLFLDFNGGFDEDSLMCSLVYVNGFNGNEHETDIRVFEDFEWQNLTKEQLKDTNPFVLLNMPTDLNLDVDDLYTAIDENLTVFELESLVNFHEDKRIFNDILDNYNGKEIKEDYYEVPKEDIGFALDSVIFDEEMTEIIIKAHNDELKVKDLVDLGKLDIDPLELTLFDTTKEAFIDVMNEAKKNHSKEEINLINNAFKNIGFDEGIFSKNNELEAQQEIER